MQLGAKELTNILGCLTCEALVEHFAVELHIYIFVSTTMGNANDDTYVSINYIKLFIHNLLCWECRISVSTS